MATPALVCFVRNFTNMYRKGFLSYSQILDNITLTNLDVIPSGPDASLEGTLLERLDHCCTPFGEHRKTLILNFNTLLIFQRIKKNIYVFTLETFFTFGTFFIVIAALRKFVLIPFFPLQYL